MVVVLPLTQSMVPPVASVAALTGLELPPVLPPLHPLTVMVEVADPVIVVQTIFVAAPAWVPKAITDAPETGMAKAAAKSNARRILTPSLFACLVRREPPTEYSLARNCYTQTAAATQLNLIFRTAVADGKGYRSVTEGTVLPGHNHRPIPIERSSA
jgi:hypothetical protein